MFHIPSLLFGERTVYLRVVLRVEPGQAPCDSLLASRLVLENYRGTRCSKVISDICRSIEKQSFHVQFCENVHIWPLRLMRRMARSVAC